MNKIVLFLLSIFFVSGTLFSQKFSFINYSTTEGLAQSQVYDIKQDSRKYLWVATLDGLSKFNGKTFSNYYEKDGLVSNKINTLYIDEFDNVWAVTSSGISIVTRDSIRPFVYNEILEDYIILNVLIHENKLWISTEENGVFCYRITKDYFNPELIRHYYQPFSQVEIKKITLINSKIYVATTRGIFTIHNSEVQKLDFLAKIDISDIKENSLGELWISTAENGVFKYSKRELDSIKQENSDLPNNYIFNLLVDSKDKVWVCSSSGVTEILEGEKINHYFEQNGFEYDPGVVFEDSEGNIWIGTNGSGLVKFTNKEFKYITKNKELHSDKILSIASDDLGGMWLGTFGEGVSRLYKGKVSSYNVRNSNLENDNFWTILKDKNDRMWFGTSKGLAYWNGNGFTTLTKSDGLPDNKVQSLFQEVSSVMWVGTKRGVAYLKDDKFIQLENFEYQNVRTIASTDDGYYWFGTSNGLVMYDGFESELVQDSLLLNNPIYTIKNYGNKLWVATQQGLIYFDGSKYERINFSQDNYLSSINFLLIDNDNFLWVGTNRGVFTINLTQFNQNRKEINSYTTNNGLISMETNLNAIFQDSENSVWFGTSEGVNIFKRVKSQLNQQIFPSVHLTNVKLFFENENYLNQLKKGKNSKFSYKNNTITFYFQTNYFKDPSVVKYSYLLEGSDEDWTPMDEVSFSRYPNLSHGEYTFKVKSTIDGKTWSKIDEVSFEITAPYWLTWWFRISLLVALFLITFYFLNRRRKALRQEREVELLNYKNKLIKLEQQSLNSSMNRHFIFNSLNSIQFYINKEDKLSANRYLSNFSKLIRKNLDSSSAEDNLIPLSEEIERLTLYLSLENMRFKEKFTYEINMDPDVDAEMTKVPAMFMQPFIENSIWHGVLPMEKPGNISIDVFKKNDKTHFEITDNGIGIDESVKNKSQEQNDHSSKGMKIATNRIELLQKVIEKEITIEGPFQINENGKIMGTKVIIIFG